PYASSAPPHLPSLPTLRSSDLLGRGNQGAMMPWVSGLAAGFPLALVLAAARSLLSGQTIGGRGLGRVCGVPLAQGELSFQVGDLLFLFGDLLFLFRDLLFLLGYLLLGVG